MQEYAKDFSIIHRYSRLYMSRAMDDCGLSGRMIPYVMVLCDNPGITQETIAREFHIDKGAVARTIAQLMEKGLVVRKANPDNKRENFIYPTEGMLRISERVKEADREFEKVLSNGLTEEEIRQVTKLLRKMSDNLLQAVGKEGCCCDKDH